MYIKRSMENFIKKAGKDFKAILVTGARQAGKSAPPLGHDKRF